MEAGGAGTSYNTYFCMDFDFFVIFDSALQDFFFLPYSFRTLIMIISLMI